MGRAYNKGAKMKTEKIELIDVVVRYKNGCKLRKWKVNSVHGKTPELMEAYHLEHKVKGEFIIFWKTRKVFKKVGIGDLDQTFEG